MAEKNKAEGINLCVSPTESSPQNADCSSQGRNNCDDYKNTTLKELNAHEVVTDSCEISRDQFSNKITQNGTSDDKFRELPKYHDKESYGNQVHHKIGLGLYITDDIEDLPPRYQKKVIKKYDELKAYERQLVEMASTISNAASSKVGLTSTNSEIISQRENEKFPSENETVSKYSNQKLEDNVPHNKFKNSKKIGKSYSKNNTNHNQTLLTENKSTSEVNGGSSTSSYKEFINDSSVHKKPFNKNVAAYSKDRNQTLENKNSEKNSHISLKKKEENKQSHLGNKTFSNNSYKNKEHSSQLHKNIEESPPYNEFNDSNDSKKSFPKDNFNRNQSQLTGTKTNRRFNDSSGISSQKNWVGESDKHSQPSSKVFENSSYRNQSTEKKFTERLDDCYNNSSHESNSNRHSQSSFNKKLPDNSYSRNQRTEKKSNERLDDWYRSCSPESNSTRHSQLPTHKNLADNSHKRNHRARNEYTEKYNDESSLLSKENKSTRHPQQSSNKKFVENSLDRNHSTGKRSTERLNDRSSISSRESSSTRHSQPLPNKNVSYYSNRKNQLSENRYDDRLSDCSRISKKENNSSMYSQPSSNTNFADRNHRTRNRSTERLNDRSLISSQENSSTRQSLSSSNKNFTDNSRNRNQRKRNDSTERLNDHSSYSKERNCTVDSPSSSNRTLENDSYNRIRRTRSRSTDRFNDHYSISSHESNYTRPSKNSSNKNFFDNSRNRNQRKRNDSTERFSDHSSYSKERNFTIDSPPSSNRTFENDSYNRSRRTRSRSADRFNDHSSISCQESNYTRHSQISSNKKFTNNSHDRNRRIRSRSPERINGRFSKSNHESIYSKPSQLSPNKSNCRTDMSTEELSDCPKISSREGSFSSSSRYSQLPTHKNFKTLPQQSDREYNNMTSNKFNKPKNFLHSDSDEISEFKRNELKSKMMDTNISLKNVKSIKESGFFLHITVSENSDNLELWLIFLKKIMSSHDFDLNFCCKFKESLILSFPCKEDASNAYQILLRSKQKNKDIKKPHILSLSRVRRQLVRPCQCEINIIEESHKYFHKLSSKYIREHKSKLEDIIKELKSLNLQKPDKFTKEHRLSLEDALNTLRDMEKVFLKYVTMVKKQLENISSMPQLRKLKADFCRECTSFGRGLPIYSRKDVILDSVRVNSVSVVIAETGSGKSTQLSEFLLQSIFASEGSIICTQPRKIAAISIARFVSKEINSNVGKEIGYDVGIEKKFCASTKIIYMTDYALLRKCLRNKNLKGISCVIIDEAHERTLYTDLLLGLIKQYIRARPDLRVIITSATINPTVFINYFDLRDSAVISVPGRAYPVDVKWLDHDVGEGFKYVNECAELAYKLHQKEPPKGDILAFLTSPAEIDEAILLFQEMCPENKMPELMSLHGKSDIQDQMLVFQPSTSNRRRIIFATNSAETSLTIPGVKYVIDSGMAKEMIFYPEKNKSVLLPSLINKSSAEQRKGRAGRTEPGICYRLYSEKNYESMPERALPELLKTNLLCALLKVYEFGLKPRNFDFVESPPAEAITRSLDSLEMLELVKDDELTKLGNQVVQLSIEPRLAKFVLQGVECKIGHEAAIIAALMSEAGRIFLRFEDNKIKADQKRKLFCQEKGDLCTFLEIYKRWLEVPQPKRFDWCVSNYISSKALLSAAKTVKEILITLHQELGIRVSKRYNNLAFKSSFEEILFSSFSENLCLFSGHQQLGYYSPYFKESLFIHPSSSLKYLRLEPPMFLVYTTLMETSRNFILDITPLKEETIKKAYQKGVYKLSLDSLKFLQISPVILGPFGEKLLTRHVLGRGGAIIVDLEKLVEKITKNRNFKIDVFVDKGQIVVYMEDRFHEKVTNFIYDVVNEARKEMAKEENIIKMAEGFSYFCLSSGGRIHDLIMPGEFRELSVKPLDKTKMEEVETLLKKIGSIQSLETGFLKNSKNKYFIDVTFEKVSEAQKAFKSLNEKKIENVRIHNIVPEISKLTNPLYRLHLSWPRLLCKGTGFVEFSSVENCTLASGRLASKHVFIDERHIDIEPSKHGRLLLAVKNLPPVVSEKTLKLKIREVLPDFLQDTLTEVQINRMESLQVVESDLTKIKDKLLQEFYKFAPSTKVMVDLLRPKATSVKYEAWVYFESDKCGQSAFQKLNNKLIVSDIHVEMVEVLQTSVICKKLAYEFLKKDIDRLIKNFGGKEVKSVDSHKSRENEKIITISCSDVENLIRVRNELIKLVQGRKLECSGDKKKFYLFTETGFRKLMDIQSITKTKINLDVRKRIVFIYGASKNCDQAEKAIHSFISDTKPANTRVFDLTNPNLPSGFLKQLRTKFEYDLFELIRKFDLRSARIDAKLKTLTFEGHSPNLRKVEEHLEEICNELYRKNPKKIVDVSDEICAICLESVSFDSYRLESCGHAFCKSCLLMQLECKLIPVACAQENCGKELFMIDIDRILSLGGENLKKEFHDAALHYHVTSNTKKISYCPTPDCCWIYRISSKSDTEFHCPGCSNDICTYCKTYSHKGMSCDIFQASKTDEDYSLKVWMKKDESYRKQCPKCAAPIEKFDGCNHMECLNCHTHLCWLCLKIFPSSPLVYDHLPYCPNNQSGAQ